MKNLKRIGIILPILAVSFFIMAVLSYKSPGIKSIIKAKLGFQKLPQPQRMQYTERFSYDSAITADSHTLARTPWPMFRHDSRHTGRSPFQGPEVPHFQWEYITNGAIVESSPAIGPDGSIYIGSHDFYLYAFTSSGVLKWKFPTLGLIRSSPLVGNDGTIYIGSFDGNLYAVTPEGSTRWSYYSGAPILSSPVIAPDGTILIASGGPKEGTLHAVTSQGDRKWKAALEGTISISSPTIGNDGTIYQLTYSGILYALNLQGKPIWQLKIDNTDGIRTTPAIAEDGTIYFGARNGNLYAIHPDGTIQWVFESGNEIRSSAAIAKDGTIYFGCYDNHLYALHPTGRLKWKFKAQGPIEVSPCVDREGVVYFAAQADHVYAVRPDGSMKWSFKRGVIYTSPIIGPDQTLYDSGDYSVRAVGNLFPSLTISLDEKALKITISNKGTTLRAVDVKIWSRSSTGADTSLWTEKISIQAQSTVDKAIDFDRGDSVVVGGLLLDQIDGEVLTEKHLFISNGKDE